MKSAAYSPERASLAQCGGRESGGGSVASRTATAEGVANAHRGLLIGLLAISIALASTIAAGHMAFAQDEGQPTSPPVVEVKAVTSRDSLERSESAQLFVIVSNKSNVTLRDLQLSITADSFVVPEPSTFPVVSGFGSVSARLTVKPTHNAKFAQHTLVVNAQYGWSDGQQEFVSVQTSTVAIKVKRRFEDELGGLLSGGAAALYFLLPFVVAVATFKVLEQLRKGQKLEFPTFGPEHLIPGAIAAVFVNLLLQPLFLLFHQDYSADLLDPASLVLVAGASIVVGALIPGIQWVWDRWQGWRWDYTGRETVGELLRKALGQHGRRVVQHDWVWVKLTKSGGLLWEGLLLKEDKDRFVLGAQLHASAVDQEVESIEREVLREDGTVLDPGRLVRLVKAGQITVEFRRKILRESEGQDPPVMIVESQGFQKEEQKSEPLIRLVK
jgi:hypothetical protein